VLALAAIEVIDHQLSMYATTEEEFGFEVLDCIDAASTALTELRYFFEEQRRPARKAGPIPDGRRKLCALVCADAWRCIHGTGQPYSRHLQEACEEYWQACGHPETSREGRLSVVAHMDGGGIGDQLEAAIRRAQAHRSGRSSKAKRPLSTVAHDL
jgi:hypothetical protein